MSEWELSDAWVFAAIGGRSRGEGVSLIEVVARGDGINHAIMLESEFVRAVPRLLAAGLIGADLQADRLAHRGWP